MGAESFDPVLIGGRSDDGAAECAENILLAREAHFPATIADLYDPEAMPDNLRAAHDRNDEVLERIYISRRFKTPSGWRNSLTSTPR